MLSSVVIAAGVVVVTAEEKLRVVEKYAPYVRVIDGAVFALPFLVLALWLEARARAARAAASAPERPVRQFGSPGGRGTGR